MRHARVMNRTIMLSPVLMVLGTAIPSWAQVPGQTAPLRTATWAEMVEQSKLTPAEMTMTPAPDHGRVVERRGGALLRDLPAPAEQMALPEALCPGFPAWPSHSGAFGFQGLLDDGGQFPPDTMGAVGPRHVMTMLNTQVRIHNRNGSLTYSTVGLDTFWAGLNAPFDPKIYYDNLSGRWIAVCLGNRESAASDWEIIISASNNPTGSWTSYHFDGDAANTRWVDFPCVGFNDKWVAVGLFAFAVPGTPAGTVTGPKMWVLNKPDLLAGGTLGFTEFDVNFEGGNGSSHLQPAVCMDPGVPELYILDSSGWRGADANQTNWLRMSRITGTPAAPAWSAMPGTITTIPGGFPVQNRFSINMTPGLQQDSATALDTNDVRMCNVVYRNGHLWAVHGGGWPADAPDRNAVFWYELLPSLANQFVQSGFIQSGGPGGGYIFPSIAVNCGNDACIGFSSTTANIYASACYVTRLAGDSPGTTSPTQYFKDGRAKYVKLGKGRNRWGDYSATMVDPLDDKTFWTLQEYAELPTTPPSTVYDRWAVQWAQITDGCPAPGITAHPQAQDICLGKPVTFSVGVNEVGVAEYQWNKNGTPINGANFYNYTIPAVAFADAGQYTCTVIGLCKATTTNPATLNIITIPTLESPAFYPGAKCPGANTIIIPPVVSGAGPITLQLQRLASGVWTDVPGRVVSPGDGFDFINIQRSDTGDYRVAVINPCGAVYSNPGRIQVGVSFDQQPVSLSKNPCESASWSVQARGNGPLAHRWRLNGTDLTDDGRIAGANSANLVVNGLRYEDEGAYSCVVTDLCGPIASDTATLTLPTPMWVQRDQYLSQRRWTAMAYDSDRRVTVLYGGSRDTPPYGYASDTWEWDGVTWTEKHPAHTPAPRRNHKMCYDSDRKRIYLWGGDGAAFYADLWAYDGNDWTLLNNTLTAHSSGYPTTTPEIAYDSVRQRLVLVRNRAGTDQNSETYEFDPETNQWTLVWPNNGFPAGYGGAMGFDSSRGVAVHFIAQGGAQLTIVSARWNGAAWAMDPMQSNSLINCIFTNMDYDSTRRRLVIFGGTPGSGSYKTESYFYSGSLWNLLLPAGPPSSPPQNTAWPLAIAYDSHRRAMVAILWPFNGSFGGPLETWEYRYLDRVVIDKQPQAQPLAPGGTASFTVYAAGYGTLSYQWKRNGQNIANGPAPGGGTFAGAATPTLVINLAGAADEGGYTVSVSNACSNLVSNTAYLGTVPEAPADLDNDGDIDEQDLGALAACALGPAVVQNDPGCAAADLDADADVDQGDFALLQRCLSGPGVAPPPGCAP